AEASALLYEDTHFLGALMVFHTESGRFAKDDVETLNDLVEPAVERLVGAEQHEVELLDEKPARILINPKLLEVEAATGNAVTWLSSDRRDELLAEIDKLDVADSSPVEMHAGGYAVWVTQMSGELGIRLLATVEHTQMPEKQPDAVLTPRQREVVGYAAAGATNREIAETLEITPDTVSDHLSEAYDRLGVANRVELALVLTQSD
ncbi:MAG: LuxR C-terminal-related transcriptional regulator, partial [Bradymonadaceae bacterium]